MNKVVTLLLLLFSGPIFYPERSPASDRPITDLIPADNLIFYMAKPYGANQASIATTQPVENAPNVGLSISTILTILNASGLIPDEGQVFADIATALPLLGRFEHALVLLDASSRIIRRPGSKPQEPQRVSLRLKHLQIAVVLHTRKEYQAVLTQLNRIAGRYTNKDMAQLSSQKSAGYTFWRLEDDRLPGWAIWEWGRLDDFFVVSFGAGAFEKVIRCYTGQDPTLSTDAWFRSSTIKAKGDQAIAQWYIALERIGDRLGVVASQRYQRVITALDAEHMTRDLWTVGLQGRALSWYRCFHRNGEDVIHHYSDPSQSPPRHTRIVPDLAEHFAIIKVPTKWLVDNLPRAWVAGQSERDIEKWNRIWKSLEQETGIDLGGNLINHLGDYIVIFDYPPHPLGIPFALTVAIEIDNPKAVRSAIDALLSTWGQYLDRRAKRKGITLLRVNVKKTEDDIWYLQAGILGPALKVTPHYVVISWSPQALRDALILIESPGPGKKQNLPDRKE